MTLRKFVKVGREQKPLIKFQKAVSLLSFNIEKICNIKKVKHFVFKK